MYLFIVLYSFKVDNQRLQGRYHWGLILHAAATFDAHAEPSTVVYQVTDEGGDGWQPKHVPLEVMGIERILGFICLPKVEAKLEDAVSSFLYELPAVHIEGAYPDDPSQWSCAWWVRVEAVRHLADAGIINDPYNGQVARDEWHEKFKQRVAARGITLEGRRGGQQMENKCGECFYLDF